MSNKDATGWAIRHWNGGIYVDTVCETRRAAIATFKKVYRVSDEKWLDDQRYKVHRAVRVTVAILAKSGESR